MAFGDDLATAVTVKKRLTLFVTIQVATENIEKFKEAHRLFGPNVLGRMNVCFLMFFRTRSVQDGSGSLKLGEGIGSGLRR
jgi:hypothetical protein